MAAPSPLPGNECEIAVMGGTPGQTDCYGAAPNDYYFSPINQVPTPYIGARSNIGTASGAIDVWGICRYIDNNSANAAFVPFSTQKEWQNFYAYAPQPQIFSLSTCARALVATVTADNNCTSPTPPNQQYNLPYARTGTPEQATVDFTCGAGSPWTGEEVQVSYLALNSDTDNPDWKVTGITYKQIGGNGTCAAMQVQGSPNCDICPGGQDIGNLPASAVGTLCHAGCWDGNGWYFSTPYKCTATGWSGGVPHASLCFLGDVTVTLADGSTKLMTELKPGDAVRGKTRTNKVISVPSHTNSGAIYGFNGGKAFVTGGHPFWTKDGWKAIDPALTPVEKHNVKTTKLQVGDELWLSDGKRLKITSIDAHDMGSQQVYSPVMDGDHTYYANGILVHNKNWGCSPGVGVFCP